MLIVFVILHRNKYINNIIYLNANFMRRVSKLEKVVELLREVHSSSLNVEELTINHLRCVCPFWPAFISGRLSSKLHVGVYPCGSNVMVDIEIW